MEAVRRSGVDVKVRVHIDNVRFVAATKADSDAVAAAFLAVCAECHIELNEEPEVNATHSAGQYLGIWYDYQKKLVSLTPKFVAKLTKVKATLSAERATAQELLSAHGVLQYASSVLQAPLVRYWAGLKLIRRTSSLLAAGSLEPTDAVNLWPFARRQLLAWCSLLLQNKPVTPLRSLDGVDATMFTDASLKGVGAVLVIAGNVWHFGRHWSREELLSSYSRCESDGVRQPNIAALELMAVTVGATHFAKMLSGRRLHICIDSTTGLGAFRKGSSKSQLINECVDSAMTALRDAKPKAAVATYIVTTKNPADLPSRDNFDRVAIGDLARAACSSSLWRGARELPALRPLVPA